MIVNTPLEDTTGFKKKFRNSRKAQEVTSFDEEPEIKAAEEVKAKKSEKLKKVIDEDKGAIFYKLLSEDN